MTSLTGLEVKRILLKAPMLVLFLFIIPVFVISALITGVHSPDPALLNLETSNYEAAYANFSFSDSGHLISYSKDTLNAPLNDLWILIASDVNYAEELAQTFNVFTSTWNPFCYGSPEINSTNLAELQNAFNTLNSSYIAFDNLVRECLSDTIKVLISEDNYNKLAKGMNAIAGFIEWDDSFNSAHLSDLELIGKRRGLLLAWDEGGANKIPSVLQAAKTTELTEEQKAKLRELYNFDVEPKLVEFESKVYQAYLNENIGEMRTAITRYADFSNICFEYLNAQMRVYQGKNFKGNISGYHGFANFSEAGTNDRIKVLEYLLVRGETNFEYSQPYSFGNTAYASNGTTPFDFVFNNLELISIPLILLGILTAIFCIYDDIKKNTVITTLVSPQGRRRIIISKLFACAIMIALVIITFSLLYYFTAVIITGAVAIPAVLTVFGGKVITISPLLLLLIYLLSLFCKIMFFASVTALFCVNAKSLKKVLFNIILIAAFVILLNFLLSKLWAIGLYQYLPFLAIDFCQYFGVKVALSAVSASINIWFTLPVLLVIWAVIWVLVVRKFNKRDF